MIRTLLGQVRGNSKRASLLTPLFTGLEVVMEVLIPTSPPPLLTRGIGGWGHRPGLSIRWPDAAAGLSEPAVWQSLAGKYAARASSGFACNLREGMYANIQTFSFSNIDKYSTAGLVTRMTTDVTNIQNAYQMILRIAVRAPLMLVCSMVMSFFISARLVYRFPGGHLGAGRGFGVLIMTKTTKIFNVVFQKYDDLNASVQENVSAIRVVKAFVREEHENDKFRRAAEKLYALFVKAEGPAGVQQPGNDAGHLRLYHRPVPVRRPFYCGRRSNHRGNLTSLFSYVMSVLYVADDVVHDFVMITMSAASGRRIAEVLEERADLSNSPQPE